MAKIVFVHGISDTKSDYWYEWRDKVMGAIGVTKYDPNKDYHGVWWEGVVDDYSKGNKPGIRSFKVPALTDEELKLKNEINTIIHKELVRWCKAEGNSIDRSLERGFLKDYLEDFIFYLAKPDLADKVQNELRKKLIELSKDDAEIHIICHSWGTVVTYDVLNRWKECPKIAPLITIGSPLWVPLVRSERRRYLENALQWANVDNAGEGILGWFNGDPIGSALNMSDEKGRFQNMSIHSKTGHLAVGYLGDDEMIEILRTSLIEEKRPMAVERENHEYIPVSLSACKDNQTAKEYSTGGAQYGAFTYFLCHELYKNKDKKLTMGNLVKVCGNSIKLANIQEQTPQLHGPKKVETSLFSL